MVVRSSFGRQKSLGLEGPTSFTVDGRTGPNYQAVISGRRTTKCFHGWPARESLTGTFLRDLIEVVRRCARVFEISPRSLSRHSIGGRAHRRNFLRHTPFQSHFFSTPAGSRNKRSGGKRSLEKRPTTAAVIRQRPRLLCNSRLFCDLLHANNTAIEHLFVFVDCIFGG
jgi:hypothetical protein